MRFVIHLLLTLMMIWCGLHIAEPASAHPPSPLEQLRTGHPVEPDERSSAPAAHASHHHCPIAPDPQPRTGANAPCVTKAAHFVAPSPRLHSHAQAPPLQPPSA